MSCGVLYARSSLEKSLREFGPTARARRLSIDVRLCSFHEIMLKMRSNKWFPEDLGPIETSRFTEGRTLDTVYIVHYYCLYRLNEYR